jgi:hypothetical protein
MQTIGALQTSGIANLSVNRNGQPLITPKLSRELWGRYFNVLFLFSNCEINGSLYLPIVKQTISFFQGEIQVFLDGPIGNPEKFVVVEIGEDSLPVELNKKASQAPECTAHREIMSKI